MLFSIHMVSTYEKGFYFNITIPQKVSITLKDQTICLLLISQMIQLFNDKTIVIKILNIYTNI